MSDVITDEERHEAATEEPTTVGCPSLVPGKLPGGMDGVEPIEKPIDPTAPAMQLPKLVKRCAKTPQTIVFEIVRQSGIKLSAEWEAEATGHSAQAFLYRDDKCVCQIRFSNDFQTRNVGRRITRQALYALASVVGHAKRWRENKKAEKGGVQ